MAFSIKCTNCGATLKTPTQIPAGKKVKCPKCAKPFVVEDEEEPEEEEVEQEEAADDEEEETPKKKPAAKDDDEDEEEEEEESEDEDDTPKKKPAAKDDDEDDEESEDEDDAPKKKPAKKDDDEDEDDEDEKPKKGKGKSGAEPKKGGNATMLLIIGGVVLLVCCIGCGTVGFVFQAGLKGLLGIADKALDDAKKEQDKKQNDAKAAGTPEHVVTAEKLAEEFATDAKAAAPKYFDKLTEVTGEVASVLPTGVGTEVTLKGFRKKPGASEFSVRLSPLPADQLDKAHRFSKGQKIKAVGKNSGYSSFGGGAGSLTIRDAVLTEVDKSGVLELSAEDLAKEFEQDSKAARAKYTNKEAIIKGVVESVKDELGGGLIRVKGFGKTVVMVRFFSNLDKGKAVAGQPIEFRCDFLGIPFFNNEINLTTTLITTSKK